MKLSEMNIPATIYTQEKLGRMSKEELIDELEFVQAAYTEMPTPRNELDIEILKLRLVLVHGWYGHSNVMQMMRELKKTINR